MSVASGASSGGLHGSDLDPFDLPEWLGTEQVAWSGTGPGAGVRLLAGVLTGPAGQTEACDLLAVDVAYPQPVVDEATRIKAHQHWVRGEVLTVELSDRLTLAVPGTSFHAERLLEALNRLARAVGADPHRYAALLSVGGDHRDTH
ncbi:hypothetical protein [Nocardioides insulae]|uniref:hypothetical protein n=1 Tax=Nocardioides insulae TaxID=394734 RepID=UPI0003FC9F7F|nr:hypothetical protein [Nocardioides insulae]